ncbi:unnamed protein product [Spirodela intermedia]|uniref:mannosyl-glycoprotein endo-beta-N-acetylglucosaminidase n=1 Tax=Spirodela intermedia TaxID=51605 RepID=A0A7I8K5M0_SPIIN|nr:unnamed protein product [Spirodela intermedia]
MDDQTDPSKPSVPVSFPVRDLESLASGSYLESFHYPFIKASVPLSTAAAGGLPPRRRLLVCHDMAGGYGDDKWVQGGSNPDAYAIWHWHLMDVFVYFSHNLVTLPPPCWMNAAHTHGVKVLGTFITEWDEGRAVCRKLLSSKDSARMYAERLVEISTSLGFDGWLINMEVELDLMQIPILMEFLSHLTQTMHAAVPGSLIIWYDSVTKYGKLRWQNMLNVKNKPFFDLCDGIFINYTWAEDYPKLSIAFAGDRKFDVYMGIDIFGRNTYGGGKWDTNVALDLLKKVDISTAIFAPGWVYETNQEPDFQTAQNRWWELVEKSWGTMRNYPRSLPFYSDFDQGHGYHFSIEGLRVADAPWNNISRQTIQPALDPPVDSAKPPIQVQRNFSGESYGGGSNLTFTGTLSDGLIFKTRLFLVELPLGDLPLHISYSVRSEGSCILGLLLSLTSNHGGEGFSILVAEGGRSSLPVNLQTQLDQVLSPSPLPRASGWTLREALIERPHHTMTEIHAVCCMKPEGSGGGAASRSFYAELGHLTIRDSRRDLPQASSWPVVCENVSWAAAGADGRRAVSAEISWRLGEGVDFPAMWYNIFARRLADGEDDGDDDGDNDDGEGFLGVTRLERFFVSDLKVPAGAVAVRFIIQVCGPDGACQKLKESPNFDLPVEEG